MSVKKEMQKTKKGRREREVSECVCEGNKEIQSAPYFECVSMCMCERGKVRERELEREDEPAPSLLLK